MKHLKFILFLFAMGSCQYGNHPLLGGIPAKIHMEIFGLGPYVFPKTSSVLPYTTSLINNPIHYQYKNNFNYTIPKTPLATDLFAPAIVKTPAATKGQIEAYQKALREEAEEELKELMKHQGVEQTSGYLIDLEPKAVSYVNVKLGGNQNVKYQYQAK